MAVSLLFLVMVFAMIGGNGTLSPMQDKIDFAYCASQPGHHCMVPVPEDNSGTGPNPNEFVTINLPQNGAPVIQGILSHANFTALENNVAVMRVLYSTTNAPPTMNYCPQAKIILENQGVPEYLDRFYNKTTGLDLTDYIYPSSCWEETGKNPVNGKGPTQSPEFGMAVLVMLLAILPAVVMRRRQA